MISTHQKTYNTLLFILVFLLALIATIYFTQHNSQKNINRLIAANKSAAVTFDINNRLQEIVNYSEVLEEKCRNLFKTGNKTYAAGAEDTIGIIEKHIVVIKNNSGKNDPDNGLSELTSLLQEKLTRVKNFLTAYSTRNLEAGAILLDSVMTGNNRESIYFTALQVQKNLEDNLKKTLSQSSGLSKKVLLLDKILSVVAILAIVILGTTIIKRLLKQLKLINNLAVEKERADKSALIKEQFLANMSHEIRTPINAVVGFSGLLQKTPMSDQQKQFVDLIQKSGENLLALVNDILDISKLEAGMMSIAKNPFSIRDTCTSLEMMFYHKATGKNISFSCHVAEDIPDTLVGDVERLNQVLINLINNAIKFTEEGEVNLQIDMLQKSKGRVNLQFCVQDTGIGIPEHKQSSIFERFEQVDSDTSRQYGGTGLGLAIVKKIINLQDGDISVKSEPGKGSAFTFHINYEYIENPENLQVHPDQQQQDVISFNGIRALVAEDNVTNQTLLKYTFQQWNLGYDLAENGKQVIRLLETNNYDIVLMDIQMPVMDGYEAARLIRKQYGNNIPIIAMTAHVLPTEREKCINSGMNDYISKPLNEKVFLNLLKKYIPYTVVQAEKPAGRPKRNNHYRYIDLEYLHHIFPGNENFISEIMYQFREQYPLEIKRLKTQLENKNLEGVIGLAHHIKTTVSSLSIDTPLRIHLDKIEDFARSGDWVEINRELNTLDQQEESVLREVDTVLTSF